MHNAIKLNIPDTNYIYNEIEDKGYYVCENCFDEEIFTNIQKFWLDYFSKENRKSFKSTNMFGQAQAIGEANIDCNLKNEKFYMYRSKDFLWNEPTHELTRNLCSEINKIRNKILNLDEYHGLIIERDREMMFSQVNYYPASSGYAFEHKDTKSNKVLISCMFNITFKNIHFDKGGLYLIINNKKVDIDEILKPCSLIFYNGNLPHGVDKIVSKNIGRMAGYPMKQFFLNKTILPKYLQLLIQADISIRRRLNLKNQIKQGNSALK